MGVHEDLKSKSFHRMYLLFGEESFLRQRYVKMLAEALSPLTNEMNILERTGSEPQLNELSSFTDTMPFLCEKRLLILHDTGLFKTSSDAFVPWLQSLPETAVVIFDEQEVDKRNKLYKTVLKEGLSEEYLCLNSDQIAKWVLRKISSAGLKIREDAFSLFTAGLSNDLSLVSSETEKLVSYALDKGFIEVSDVKAVAAPTVENHIFTLVENVSKRNRKGAVQNYYELLALKEAPMRILFLISQEFMRLSATKDFILRSGNDEELASSLKINPKIVWKYKKQAASFSARYLEEALKTCVLYEQSVKIGNLNERTAVEMLIFTLTEG